MIWLEQLDAATRDKAQSRVNDSESYALKESKEFFSSHQSAKNICILLANWVIRKDDAASATTS